MWKSDLKCSYRIFLFWGGGGSLELCHGSALHNPGKILMSTENAWEKLRENFQFHSIEKYILHVHFWASPEVLKFFWHVDQSQSAWLCLAFEVWSTGLQPYYLFLVLILQPFSWQQNTLLCLQRWKVVLFSFFQRRKMAGHQPNCLAHKLNDHSSPYFLYLTIHDDSIQV